MNSSATATATAVAVSGGATLTGLVSYCEEHDFLQKKMIYCLALHN